MDSERAVAYEEAFKFCESLQIPYIEASCKYNINVEESYLVLVYQILSNIYDIPSLYSLRDKEEWNEKIHFKFSKAFKDSIFTFFACLDFLTKKKKKPKIPKFVLFEIIKFITSPPLRLCNDFVSYVKQYSRGEQLVRNAPVVPQIKKRDCKMF